MTEEEETLKNLNISSLRKLESVAEMTALPKIVDRLLATKLGVLLQVGEYLTIN